MSDSEKRRSNTPSDSVNSRTHTSLHMIGGVPGLKLFEGRNDSDHEPVLIHEFCAAETGEEVVSAAVCELRRRLAGVSHPCLPSLRSATGRRHLTTSLPRGLGLGHPRVMSGLSADGRLPWELAVVLLDPVLECLEAAHAAGLVHGALHPARVVLNRDRSPLLWGLGVIPLLLGLGPPPPPGAPSWPALFFGPGWIAPELLRPPDVPEPQEVASAPAAMAAGSPATDVYGAALLLLALKNGATPFQADSSLLVYNRVLAGLSDEAFGRAAAGLPSSVKDLLHDALRRDPAERPQRMADLRAALPNVTEDSLPCSARGALAGIRSRCGDEPYTGYLGRHVGAEQRASAGEMNPEERARELRLAEIRLEGLRGRKRTKSSRWPMWFVTLVAILLLAFFASRGVEHAQTPPRHEGPVDPVTGYSHVAPRMGALRPEKRRESVIERSVPRPARRRPLSMSPVKRVRSGLEGYLK